MTASSAQTLSTAPLPTLNGLDLRGKRVLLRVDLNVLRDEAGIPLDTFRISAILPTLKRLLRDGARVGILTHWGRPGGRVVPALSTQPLAELLSELLGQSVPHVPDCIGRVAENAMNSLEPGHVVMLENVRFHLGEQLNQSVFVEQLCRLADVFVNDAFATAHRAHASTSGLMAAMPQAVVGELMLQELDNMRMLGMPMGKGSLLILGGSGVEEKLDLLRHMLGHVDVIMLGGTLANTFLAARDLGMGRSSLAPTHVDKARELLTEAGVVGCRLHLPQDVWVKGADGAKPVATHLIGSNESVVDIGPNTLEMWTKIARSASKVLMLGSLGVVEHDEGQRATRGLLKALDGHSDFSLVGGEALLPLIAQEGLTTKLRAITTGSAALVHGLAGKPYPFRQVMKI